MNMIAVRHPSAHRHESSHTDHHGSISTVERPDITAEHRRLAGLAETVGKIYMQRDCKDHCGQCNDARRHSCSLTLADVGGRMMALMLDHFHREDEFMNRLPQHGSVKSHCEKHRCAHVSFTTRYNSVVAGIEPGNTVQYAKAFESFILDWIRDHALEFDHQLVGLLQSRQV